MENRILIEIGYEDRIRSKMGVSEPYLPNKDINYPDIITVAETNIIGQLPDYTTLIDDSRTYLETVVVLECCILLCPSMSARLPKKETGPHAGHELYVNWDNKKLEFTNDRNELLGKILELNFPDDLSPTLLNFSATYPIRKW